MKHFLTLPAFVMLIFLNSCTDIVSSMRSEPIQPDPSETSIGTDLDDFQMGVAVGVNIDKASQELKQSHVNVKAYNGVVLLTGEVPSQDARILAGNVANQYRGVRLVHNELQVQGKSSFLSRTNDNWLLTKLKTKYLASEDVRSGAIDIVVEQGAVYLMGITSRQEADRAAEIASNTGGVRRVVKLFEYLD